jgi:hypothetical protein
MGGNGIKTSGIPLPPIPLLSSHRPYNALNSMKKNLADSLIEKFEKTIQDHCLDLGEDGERRCAQDAIFALTHVLGKQAALSKNKHNSKHCVMYNVLSHAVGAMQQQKSLEVEMELFVHITGPKGERVKD